jgi:DNA polymerase-3 subunit alpha
MQIAQVMAGYSLGGADLLRRAMGKKIKEAMDAERPKFEQGAAENGVPAKKASEVFDLLEKFANYGFNKSHAAAYAVVSYQTGWLKANHPAEFMAGVMNCDIHLTDKLSIYAEEVRRGLDIEIVPPCVNRALPTFDVVDGKLIYALGALKNVGLEAMKLITEGRRVDGVDKPFATLFDFARRVDLKRVGKRPLEMLARAGAFDQLDPNRRRVFEALDALVGYSSAIHEQKASNQVSLFGEAGDDLPEPRILPVEDWLPADRLAEEHKAVGFYLTGHPLDDYLPALKRKKVLTLEALRLKAEDNGVARDKVGVLVSGLQERKSGRGTRFFRMNVSDPTGQVAGMVMFPDDFEATRKVFEQTNQVVMTLEGRFNEGQFDPMGRSVAAMDTVIADAGSSGLKVLIEDAAALQSVANILEKAREAVRGSGKGPVQLCLIHPELPGEVEIDAGDDFPVNPQIKGALKSLAGVVDVQEV